MIVTVDAGGLDAGLFDAGGPPDAHGVDAGAPWNLPYLARRAIHVDGTQVTATLQDFPVLVRLDASPEASGAQAAQIAFFSSTDVLWGADITHYDPGTGSLEAYVRVPQLVPGQNTTFYAYFHPAGTPPVPPPAWSDDFVGVWHLDQGNVGDTVPDSSQAQRDGILQPQALDPNNPFPAGVVGRASHFSGTAGVQVPWSDAAAPSLASLSLSAWVSVDDENANRWMRLFVRRPAFDSVDGLDVVLNPNPADTAYNLHTRFGPNNYLSLLTPPPGQGHPGWTHVFLRATEAGLSTLWINGVLVDEQDVTPYFDDPDQDVWLATVPWVTTDEWLDGTLDEVLLLDQAVPAGWAEAVYASQRPNSDFVTVDPAEGP